MAKSVRPRIVQVEFPTPALYRWFIGAVRDRVSHTDDGFVVHDEERWTEALRAADGREVSWSVRIRQITLTVRDGRVVGAMGSDPDRFVGLAFADARKLAAGRAYRKES